MGASTRSHMLSRMLRSVWGSAIREAQRAAALLAFLGLVALVPMAAPAGAQTVGYLYTALAGNVERFEVGAGGELTAAGSVVGGTVTPADPGSLVMAKTADGESLYLLSKAGSTQTIHQYSVDSSTGAVAAMSPATVGSIPSVGEGGKRFMAVFNPGATGAAGQNALYVLSGTSEHAKLYMFDIDAITGALTQVEAEGIEIPGMRTGVALAYSGKVLTVTGGDASGYEVFQRAVLEQSTGDPGFESLPDSPCPGQSCDDGTMYMLDEEQMLSANVVLDVGAKVPETYKPGVSSYDVGGAWDPVASYLTHRPGPGDLTSIGSRYFGSEYLSMSPFEIEDGEFQTSEYGHSWIEEFDQEGAPEGFFDLPGADHVPYALLALGSQLFVANASEGGGAFVNGDRLTPSEGVAMELGSVLGAAIAGFLTGESKAVGKEEEKGAAKEGGAEAGGKASEYALAVTLAGAGKGQVAGMGIACPGTCSAFYPAGTLVALVAKPAPGFTFAGWAGSCAGTSACNVTMSAPSAVTASFSIVPPPNTKIVSIKHAGSKATIRFTGSGGYGKLTFHCRLGAAKKATKCSSPLVYPHLAPGKHHFSVAAADSRPIVDPTPAKATFITK
jgi:hypothetical protein